MLINGKNRSIKHVAIEIQENLKKLEKGDDTAKDYATDTRLAYGITNRLLPDIAAGYVTDVSWAREEGLKYMLRETDTALKGYNQRGQTAKAAKAAKAAKWLTEAVNAVENRWYDAAKKQAEKDAVSGLLSRPYSFFKCTAIPNTDDDLAKYYSYYLNEYNLAKNNARMAEFAEGIKADKTVQAVLASTNSQKSVHPIANWEVDLIWPSWDIHHQMLCDRDITDISLFLAKGMMIQAIKVYRTSTTTSLIWAKGVMDALGHLLYPDTHKKPEKPHRCGITTNDTYRPCPDCGGCKR